VTVSFRFRGREQCVTKHPYTRLCRQHVPRTQTALRRCSLYKRLHQLLQLPCALEFSGSLPGPAPQGGGRGGGGGRWRKVYGKG